MASPNPRNLVHPAQCKVNLSDGLRDALVEAARKSNRTLTQEIRARLEATINMEFETVMTHRIKPKAE